MILAIPEVPMQKPMGFSALVDIDYPDLKAVQLPRDIHEAELKAVHARCIVAEPKLESLELSLCNVYKAILET